MCEKMFKTAVLGFAGVVLGISQLNAQTLTVTSAVPVPGPNDIYNLPGNPSGATYARFAIDYNTGSDSGSYYSNNYPGAGPAQTFTTGANEGGYTLTSVTVGVAPQTSGANESIHWESDDTLSIGTVNGGVFTSIYTATATSSGGENYGNFVTFTLPVGLSLNPNTVYAYVFGNRDNTGFFPLALESHASYAGGAAATLNTSTNTLTAFTGSGGMAMDAMFDIALTANASPLLTVSSTMPIPGPNDIYNLPGNPSGATYARFAIDYNTGSDSGSYYSNNYPGAGPAQTFTTGTNSGGYILTSVTVGVAPQTSGANESIHWESDDTLSIGTVNGGVFTSIYTATATSSGGENYGNFVTFTLPVGLSLNPNTVYAYVFGNRDNTGFFPLALDSHASYAGGTAATLNTNTNALSTFTGVGGHSMDAMFDIGLTPNVKQVLSSGGAIQALQSDAFVDSVGLAVHLNYDPSYSNWSTFKPLLTGLGIRHIRDGVSGGSTDSRFVDLAANYGIKATMVSTETGAGGLLDSSQIPGELSYLQNTTYSGASILSAVEAIEGPNEYDLNYGSDPNWVSTLTAYQQTLYNDIKGNSAFKNVLVLGPAIGQATDLASLPNMSSMVDAGNDHPYCGSSNPGCPALSDYLHYSQIIWPSAPLQASEDGYSTAGTDGPTVPEAVQAKYEPRLVLENFRRGVQRTYLYDFADEEVITGSIQGNHFGLVHYDGTLKQSYTNIKNLLSILNDPGAPFSPGILSYNLSGTTANIHTLLLQKRNGQYYLVLWVETLNAASQPVTVTFDEPMGTTYVYHPDTSTSGTLTSLTNNSLSLTLTDEPTIIETYPTHPTGSLLVDDLSSLGYANSFLNWQSLAASPIDWLGRTTEAQRIAANGNNALIYSSVDIRGFTAILGINCNVTSSTNFTFDFTNKVLCYASPDGSIWTPVTITSGEVDKTLSSLAQYPAYWLVPVMASGPLPPGTNYLKFVVNSTDDVSQPTLFQMNIRQSGVIEAESMAVASSGATTATVSNSNASNGYDVQLGATAAGQSMTFTTAQLPPGVYNFSCRYLLGSNYGNCQIAIDGAAIGNVLSQSGSAGSFVETLVGSISFMTAGKHTISFTATSSPNGYAINCDRVVFQQQEN